MKRFLSVAAGLLAGLMALVAALLVRPNDLVEFFAGFAGSSVTQLQLVTGALAVGLAALAWWLRRGDARWTRGLGIVIMGTLVLTALATLRREAGSYRRQTVSFTAEGLPRVGTLYRPRNAPGSAPAVVVLHGSGDIRRGGYHFLARRFAEHGFVALIFDKRGVGDSPGRYYGDDLGSGEVIGIRTREAIAALEYLAASSGVDRDRIGVVTISQGGWVMGPLLDGSTPARFAINLSGPAVSTGEEGQWSEWTDEDRDHFGMKPPPVPYEELDRRMQAVRASGHDPRAALTRMKWPSLWLYGEWDSSLPVNRSVAVLDSLTEMGVPITWRMFPESNHGLFVVRGPNGRRLARYAPGVWDTVFAWTSRQRITRVR